MKEHETGSISLKWDSAVPMQYLSTEASRLYFTPNLTGS